MYCQVNILDRFCPPPAGPDGLPEEISRSTRRFCRWFEGMRQTGWTLATILMIMNVANQLNKLYWHKLMHNTVL